MYCFLILSFVILVNSSILIFLILHKLVAIILIFLGSLTVPLKGTGDKYGLSVSSTMFFVGIFSKTLVKLVLEKVDTPPIPSKYPLLI